MRNYKSFVENNRRLGRGSARIRKRSVGRRATKDERGKDGGMERCGWSERQSGARKCHSHSVIDGRRKRSVVILIVVRDKKEEGKGQEDTNRTDRETKRKTSDCPNVSNTSTLLFSLLISQFSTEAGRSSFSFHRALGSLCHLICHLFNIPL